MSSQNFVAFLYTLMRDELPTGKVAAIIQQLEQAKASSFEFTNKPLAQMAVDYHKRLLEIGQDEIPW